MRLGISIAVVCLLGPPAVSQGRPDRKSIVKEDDPHFDVLDGYRRRIRKEIEKPGQIVVDHHTMSRLDSEAASRLFPGLCFYSLQWMTSRHPDMKGKEICIVPLRRKVVAVGQDSGEVEREFSSSGNPVKFLDLLLDHDIVLRDADDAEAVWQAFCDIQQHRWRTNRPTRKISATRWHLGVYTYERTRPHPKGGNTIAYVKRYTEVVIDEETKRIVAWNGKSETSDEPHSPSDRREDGSTVTGSERTE